MPTVLGRHDIAGSLSRFWQTSYASDYLGLLFILIIDGLIQAFVEPFHRLIRLDNPAIHWPHAVVERVPVGWLFVFGLGLPVIVFTCYGLIAKPSFHKLHVTYLGLFISVALTTFLTDVLKNAIGRPRPDLRDRCNAHQDTPRNQLIPVDMCMQVNQHLLHDGWRSFPSGHSSFSFSGLGYLFFFCAAQFRVFHPAPTLPAQILTFCPLFGALLIAISRLEDYRHDVYDVSAGAILGLSMAYLTYRRYYPSVYSQRCETPYPSRADIMAASARWPIKRSRDEEATVGMPISKNGDLGHRPSNPINGFRTVGPDIIGTVDSDDDTERERKVLRSTNSPVRSNTPR